MAISAAPVNDSHCRTISLYFIPTVLLLIAKCSHSTLVGQKTLFALKPCGAPIFCVIGSSIYQLTNKILYLHVADCCMTF
jgi:hypothetical protein